jgi:hypothetical protein
VPSSGNGSLEPRDGRRLRTHSFCYLRLGQTCLLPRLVNLKGAVVELFSDREKYSATAPLIDQAQHCDQRHPFEGNLRDRLDFCFSDASSRFSVQPHAERACNFEDGCETWVAVLAESLVQTLTA